MPMLNTHSHTNLPVRLGPKCKIMLNAVAVLFISLGRCRILQRQLNFNINNKMKLKSLNVDLTALFVSCNIINSLDHHQCYF